MRYRPVVLARVTQLISTIRPNVYTKDIIRQLLLEEGAGTESYWQVRSRLLGDCGHKHETIASAQECYEYFKRVWARERSVRSKRGWEKRRAKLQGV